MDNMAFWSKNKVTQHLPIRQQDGHKGSFGHALLIAGSPGMPGAAVLAAVAAVRSGLGKLTVATSADAVQAICSFVPEATFEKELLNRMNDPQLDLGLYSAVAIGPGMLPDQKTEAVTERLLQEGKPLVLDAGALSQRNYSSATAPVILTPHPAEFSRITGVPVKLLQQDRAAYASEWALKLRVAIVLKGPRTVIAFPDGQTFINPTGNSALAKGGTGDTLTGMILGMLCCHENWRYAVLNAVHLHGACADEWIRTRSPHSLLAHELSDLLPFVWKSYEK